MSAYDAFNTAKEAILNQLKAALAKQEGNSASDLLLPQVLIVCGSGLGGIADLLKGSTVKIPYENIPGFKSSTVAGHEGCLLFGHIGSNQVPVVCMVGRLHFYEGYEFEHTTFPIRVAAELGVKTMVVTNAAGGTNPDYKPGDLMIINDHLNFPGLAGFHPLRGPNLSRFGPRFLPQSDAYDFDLRLLLVKQAKETLKLSRTIHEGVYFFAAGPTYESRAEVRMIRALGGDSVGMSTVPEVIVARHCGIKVLGLSLITNAGLGEPPVSATEFFVNKESEFVDQKDGMANHEEVLESANSASEDVKLLVEAFVNALPS